MRDKTANWARCIYIDGEVNESLLNALIPKVLALRQESSDPITVGINSPGGAVYVLEPLRSMIRAADQDGNCCELIAVATHRAYSAAAMFLAMGDYAVALPHSEILFHDVRYGAVHDVTPTSALEAAQQLEVSNDSAAAQIAEFMFPRWMWIYLDVHLKVGELREQWPDAAKRYVEVVERLELPKCDSVRIDLAGLLLFMYSRLGTSNECVLENAISKLERWGVVRAFTDESVARNIVEQEGQPEALAGLAGLYRQFDPEGALFGGADKVRDLVAFMTVLAACLTKNSAQEAVQIASKELNLFRAIDNPRHWQIAMRLMLRHKAVFFKYEIAEGWDNLDESEKRKIRDEATPIVRVIWLLCVLVARELFRGEHRLNPTEALVLGLVDEVAGGVVIESRRQFARKQCASATI